MDRTRCWLHILIFNLRIDARERNSDVLFTIGNHDLYSVLLPRAFTDHALWRSYTDERHVQFAPDGDGDAWDRRALALMVRLGSVLFVHGGLLDKPNVMRGNKGANIYEMTQRAQERIHERMTGPVGPIAHGPDGPDGLHGPDGPPGPRGLLVAMREAIREYTDYACSAESGLQCANVTEARGYAELKRKDICTNSETQRLVHEEWSLVTV